MPCGSIPVERSSLEALFGALERAGARYLVAGGLAVLAHGFVRVTLDVDLVLDLEPPHPGPALDAFRELDLRPLVPVPLEEFADAAKRQSWVRDKQARVFQLWSERYPTLRVDLFLEPPFDFATAHLRRHRAEIAKGLEVSFVALHDLLAMKRVAARPQDLADIDRLERIRRASRSGD
jgi:hypothetical protein